MSDDDHDKKADVRHVQTRSRGWTDHEHIYRSNSKNLMYEAAKNTGPDIPTFSSASRRCDIKIKSS